MAKRYYNLEKETKVLLKKWEVRNGILPDSAGITRVNEYILRKKGLGQIVGFSKFGGNFVATSRQGISVSSNATLQVGDVDFTMGCWVNMRLVYQSGYETIMGKGNPNGANGEFYLMGNNGAAGGPLMFRVRNTANSAINAAVTVSTLTVQPTSNVWAFVIAWHDSVANTLNIQMNNGTVVSQSWSTGVYVGTQSFTVGFQGGSNFLNGIVDSAFFIKSVLSANDRTYLYNSGNGTSYLELLAYRPDLLTSMVSYWPLSESNGTRFDAHGTNHLSVGSGSPINTVGVVEEIF